MNEQGKPIDAAPVRPACSAKCEFVAKMSIPGAVLHRDDVGTSSWCTVWLPDGSRWQVPPIPLNEKSPLPLRAIAWDGHGVPTQYVRDAD